MSVLPWCKRCHLLVSCGPYSHHVIEFLWNDVPLSIYPCVGIIAGCEGFVAGSAHSESIEALPFARRLMCSRRPPSSISGAVASLAVHSESRNRAACKSLLAGDMSDATALASAFDGVTACFLGCSNSAPWREFGPRVESKPEYQNTLNPKL